MAHIGFVSTSILESKDGVAFNEESRKETDETREAAKLAKQAEAKPLWEQLAARNEDKQAQFDAVRAAIFAPTKALDDEEVEYLENVEEQRRQAKLRKEEWELKELRAFTLARANQTVSIVESKKERVRPEGINLEVGEGGEKGGPSSAAPLTAPVVSVKIKPKRKHKVKDNKRSKKGKATPPQKQESEGQGIGFEEGKQPPLQKDPPPCGVEGTGVEGTEASLESPEGESVPLGHEEVGLSSLVGVYGSDSDASEEGD